ncbi:MAG TPA: PAS domain-containing sensor histidine kinase, partial [Desulfobacteraceae bacterium]|nr:PAS domain-containing sensor histidine kinase [Desulfobacteraceae bacterium]
MKDDDNTMASLHIELAKSKRQIAALKLARNELREREKKLKESEVRLRSLVDAALDRSKVGVFILDSEFNVVWVSDALRRYFGLGDADIVGKDKRQLIHERIKGIFENPEWFQEKVLATYDNNTYVESFECHVLPGAGRKERWLRHWSEPIELGTYSGGRIEHYIDITDQKNAEAERIRLATALEQTGESVMITDTATNIQYVNPAFEKISGYSREEVMGKNPRLLQSGKHDQAFYQELWEALSAGRIWKGIFVNKKKDGELYKENATISPITNKHGKTISYVAVKRDVTREIKLEEQLRQAQKMESIGVLAGGVAHDFNNLLTTIMGNADLALMDLKEDTSAQRNVLEIQKAAQRAASLTRQLLTFSRKQVIQPTVLNLNHVVSGLEKMLRRLIGEDIDFLTAYEPEPWHVFVDPGQMEQVIMNLVVNARDAMPKGGKLTIETANVQLDSGYLEDHGVENTPGSYVMLAVTDTGVGIDSDIRPHIFDPFFTTKERGRGTGLGLATVYGIVKQNKGYLWVYSELGEGTTFKVYLPRSVKEEELVDEKMPTGNQLRGVETVLVVEDDETLRNTVKKMLQGYGYRVILSRDGQ